MRHFQMEKIQQTSNSRMDVMIGLVQILILDERIRYSQTLMQHANLTPN